MGKECLNRLNTGEKRVLGKLDHQDLMEMLRRQGLKKQYDRVNGLSKKEERPFEPSDMEPEYERAYKAHYNYPQRASRRPIAAPIDTNLPPGDFTTQTHADFVPKPVHPIELITKNNEYKPATGKVDGKSAYMEDYPAKYQEVHMAQRPDLEPAGAKIKAKFDGRTMHKEHYKAWVGKDQDKMIFKELDPVADSIIFPKGHAQNGISETKYQFPGKYAQRPEAAKMAQPTVKLGIEGDFDHLTVNKATFKSTVGREQKAINYRPANKIPGDNDNREAFFGESKYMYDYKEKNGSKRGPMIPKPNNIAVDRDAKGDYQTWQKDSYQGYDVTKHKRPAEIRFDKHEYAPPTEKVDGVTITKQSYPRKEIGLAYNPPKRANVHERGELPRFDDTTMHGQQFVPWDIQPRERFGDFKENAATIPLQGHFYGETTTGRVFTPKQYKKTDAFIPVQKAIDNSGDHDFNTVHRTTYIKPKYNLDQADYAILQQALKKVAKYGGGDCVCGPSSSRVSPGNRVTVGA